MNRNNPIQTGLYTPDWLLTWNILELSPMFTYMRDRSVFSDDILFDVLGVDVLDRRKKNLIRGILGVFMSLYSGI